jgi:mono/diheme cytochrome c family protein
MKTPKLSSQSTTTGGAPSFALLRRVGGENAGWSFRSLFGRINTKPLLTAALAIVLAGSAALFAESDGKWLHRVPDEDRARANPVAAQPQAAAAGKMLFAENCAKCHGADANGLHNRPSLRSERIRHATDGELAWMLKNGNPYKGMPPWSSLPEQQRWQIIAYLRTLPPAHPAGN